MIVRLLLEINYIFTLFFFKSIHNRSVIENCGGKIVRNYSILKIFDRRDRQHRYEYDLISDPIQSFPFDS